MASCLIFLRGNSNPRQEKWMSSQLVIKNEGIHSVVFKELVPSSSSEQFSIITYCKPPTVIVTTLLSLEGYRFHIEVAQYQGPGFVAMDNMLARTNTKGAGLIVMEDEEQTKRMMLSFLPWISGAVRSWNNLYKYRSVGTAIIFDCLLEGNIRLRRVAYHFYKHLRNPKQAPLLYIRNHLLICRNRNTYNLPITTAQDQRIIAHRRNTWAAGMVFTEGRVPARSRPVAYSNQIKGNDWVQRQNITTGSKATFGVRESAQLKERWRRSVSIWRSSAEPRTVQTRSQDVRIEYGERGDFRRFAEGLKEQAYIEPNFGGLNSNYQARV
ncbi:hypothetical protein ARMGADRAFT_1036471 [Armillaria gallica]|uniref:Uncharacterized protein n=1 Tax=Armillaria gallica TaxID=47427 RepID=A0A2H3CQW9_ARMGA|nr:hypothetical protein ARMGADRAFT_1036471 [Armillaria gallica]